VDYRREQLFRLLIGKVNTESVADEDFAAAEKLADEIGIRAWWIEEAKPAKAKKAGK
jgi:hypothetical protein